MSTLLIRCAVAALALTALATAADAKCSRLGFTVNDYGKDGPTNDAKNLLDKHIAKWAADNKIKSFTTGKKDVKCDLFLDVGLFDEYTCTAEANVCYGGPAVPAPATPVAMKGKPAAAKPAAVPVADKPKG